MLGQCAKHVLLSTVSEPDVFKYGEYAFQNMKIRKWNIVLLIYNLSFRYGRIHCEHTLLMQHATVFWSLCILELCKNAYLEEGFAYNHILVN